MTSLHNEIFIKIFKLVDLLLLSFMFIVSDAVVHPPVSVEHIMMVITSQLTILGILFTLCTLLIWHLVLVVLGAYSSHRIGSYSDEVLLIIKGLLICVVIAAISGKIFNIKLFTFEFFIHFYLFSAYCLVLFRMILRVALRTIRSRGKNIRFILIAGTGTRALKYASILKSKPELGYVIKGFIDSSWCGEESLEKSLPPIVCDFNNISEYLKNNVVDEIFICLPLKTCYEEIHDIVSRAEEQGIIVHMPTDLFRLKVAKEKVQHIGSNSLITMISGDMYRSALMIKSILDFFAALILIIMFIPVLLAVAAAIKFTSKGPVFFVQPRIGMNKRIFKVIKFRTMIVDAEKKMAEIVHLNERKDGAAFKIKDDPRVTPVGKILRKYSLDELPQLFNVLKGEMSLVGPRPLPIRDYKEFNQDKHRRRFSVKPGITCIWQVSGRDNIPFEEWMEMDMQYIDNWSLWLDMKILLKTVPVCVLGIGAS